MITRYTPAVFPITVFIIFSLLAFSGESIAKGYQFSAGKPGQQDLFADVVAHRGIPESVSDWSFAPFADQGAWFGFALPPSGSEQNRGGFSGPFLMANGHWAARQLLVLTLHDAKNGQEIDFSSATEHSFTSRPGVLEEHMRVDGLSLTQTLWYDRESAERSGIAVIRASFSNTSTSEKLISIGWKGSVFNEKQRLAGTDRSLTVHTENAYQLRISFDSEINALDIGEHSFRAVSGKDLKIGPGEPRTIHVVIDMNLAGDTPTSAETINTILANADKSFRQNRQRWDRWLTAVDPGPEAGKAARLIAVKSLQTLVNNWRGPAGRLKHHGMFPSHNVWYFNGYWAWDTWKQAVGVLLFDAELAKAMVKGMFEHQDKHGMIADVVYLDAREDNWRDSKPPLAGWAIEAIYRQTGDLDFIRDLYPKLIAYHEFWYRDRDHNGNGLCEYGSTDGTLEAARWESGMDNAVRFDDTRMLQNNEHAWSMDQESVDLNSYLYLEKKAIAHLARALGFDDRVWLDQADELADSIRETFYDENSGWFYDINIDDGSFIATQSPEGWTPLWTGIASSQQAERLRQTIMDPEKFRTHIPFPTVAADNAEFSEGYWRGLVWLDQAYFGIDGLRRYGYDQDAGELTRQLFFKLGGAATPGEPIFENYHPLSGKGHNVRHFSWSAAHLLMLTATAR